MQKPPRVLFGIGGLGAGGSEVQLVELLTRVHPHRIEAVLVTLSGASDGGPRLDRIRAAGIEHHVIGKGRGPLPVRTVAAAARYWRVIRAVNPDAVYPWLEETSLFMAPLARLAGIPVLVARRNVAGARSERLAHIRWLIRRAEAGAAIVTVNSAAGRAAACSRGIRPDRVRVVVNGHAAVDPALLPGESPVTLGYLARFRPEKGHLRLLEALRRLPDSPNWRVLLGGDGPLDAEIRAGVRRAGLEDRVEFAGLVTDSRAFWAQCDVAVLLSDHEGSPNALIEAAFAGRPIVATAVGGTPDVVADGAGFLVDPDAPVATADALQRLISDPELRAAMGSAGHAAVSRRFTLDAFVEGHLAAISETLATAARA